MSQKPCLVCQKLGPESYCPAHKPKPFQGARKNATPRQMRNTSEYKMNRKRALQRDEYTCQDCGDSATEVDHIQPLSLGGTNEMSNLVSVCHDCHLYKTRQEQARRNLQFRRK